MASAGTKLRAGRVPGERIGTTEVTTSVTGITNADETITHSVTVPVVSGRTYGITLHTFLQSNDTANLQAQAALREDDEDGTRHAVGRFPPAASTGVAYGLTLYAEYPATATGNKTFVGTMIRVGGSGDCRMPASSTQKAYIRVDYISG